MQSDSKDILQYILPISERVPRRNCDLVAVDTAPMRNLLHIPIVRTIEHRFRELTQAWRGQQL